jgi:tetratricopeptide (TPR) repeat protein
VIEMVGNELTMAFQNLPEPVQKAVIGAASKIAISSAGNVFKKILAYLGIGSQTAALRKAIALTLRYKPEAEAIGIAGALARDPLKSLIVHVVENPTKPVDENAINTAFDESIFDMHGIGIEPVQFVEQLQKAYLESLRLSSDATNRDHHSGVRHEQNHQMLRQLVERNSDPPDSLSQVREALFDEAKALRKRGLPKEAYEIAERLERQAKDVPNAPKLWMRIHNLKGACMLDCDEQLRAIAEFKIALQYTPDNVNVLVNLAQAELIAGNEIAAVTRAKQTIEIEPNNAGAWSVLLQTANDWLFNLEVPESLKNDEHVLTARAVLAEKLKRPDVLECLREVLRNSSREPKILVEIGGRIYHSMFPRRSDKSIDPAILDEIDQLACEAIEKVTGTQHTQIEAKAWLLRSGSARLREQVAESKQYLKRALEIDPKSIRSRYVEITDRISEKDTNSARYLLDQIEPNHDVLWHALNAQILVLEGRSAQLDKPVAIILSACDDAEFETAIGMAIETILVARRFDLAAPVMAAVEQLYPTDFVMLYAARLARIQGNVDLAATAYQVAIQSSHPPEHKIYLLEFAHMCFENGDMHRTIELTETDASWQIENGRKSESYGFALLELQRWSSIESMLAWFDENGPRPVWAFNIEAHMSRERGDYRRAITAFQSVLAVCSDLVAVKAHLALLYIQLGDLPNAAALFDSIDLDTQRDPYNCVNLALALVSLDRHAEALKLGYRTIVGGGASAEVEAACILRVFLAVNSNDPEVQTLMEREAIGLDTWFKVQPNKGADIEFFIVNNPSSNVQLHEFDPADPAVQDFIGRRVGESVILNKGKLNETGATVVAVKSRMLYVFQNAMMTFETRFPGKSGLQMIHVGEGKDFDINPVIQMLSAKASDFATLIASYKKNHLPLGVIARSISDSTRCAVDALRSERIPQYTTDLHDSGRARDASAKSAVVITATAMKTLADLGKLELLPQLYSRIVAPQSLVNEIDTDIRMRSEEIARGGTTIAGMVDSRIRTVEISGDMISATHHRLVQLRSTIVELAVILPIPTQTDPEFAPTRRAIGNSSFDACILATPEMPLYADDYGLRYIAQQQRNAPSFTTFDLLSTALERSMITQEDWCTSLCRLIEWKHEIIPVSADLLYGILLKDVFEIREDFLRALTALANGHASIGGAVAIIAALIRQLATSSFGKQTVATVTSIAMVTLSENNNPAVVGFFLHKEAREALKLLPDDLATVTERIQNFLSAKNVAATKKNIIL